MRVQGMLVLVGLLAVTGCDKGADGAKPGGSPAPAAGGGKTSLTRQQLDDAYALTDPDHYDKSLAAVTAKLGPPAKSDAESATWYGTTPDGGCNRLLLSKSKGNEVGTTDAASCK